MYKIKGCKKVHAVSVDLRWRNKKAELAAFFLPCSANSHTQVSFPPTEKKGTLAKVGSEISSDVTAFYGFFRLP